MDDKMIENKTSQKIQWKEHAIIAIKAFVVFALLLGLVYPLLITGIAQLTMSEKANGSLVKVDGKIIGSTKIGQRFIGDEYFHSRPSSVDYDASTSGGSNLAPTSKELKETVEQRILQVKKEEKIDTNVNIPSDMVTASASGLDPNISIENAKLQSKRVAKKRNLTENELNEIVDKNIDPDFLGIWGQESVNVLKLNMALDGITGK